MFYNYGLTADSSGSNLYSKAVGAASAQSSAGTPRKGAQNWAVGAVSGQNVGYGSGDPFSIIFSPDFGGGAGNYILLAVNAIRGAVDANIAAVTRLKFTGHAASPSVASPQSVSATRKHIGVLLLGLASGQAWSLTFPRINHVIVAAKNANASGIVRGLFLAFGMASPEVAFKTLIAGHTLGVTSPSTEASGLQRFVSKILTSVHEASQVVLQTPGRQFHAINASVQSLLRRPGKMAAAASSEAGSITRGLPLHNAAVSTQSPRMSFGGNLFARTLSVALTQALLLARGMAVGHAAVDAQVVLLLKTAGLLRGAVDAATVLLIRTPGCLRSVASPDVAAAVRATSLPRGVIDASVSFLLATTARFRSFGAVDGQLAAALALHGRPLLASVASAQAAALARLNTLSHLLPLGAVSAQVAALVRNATLSHPLPLGAVSAQALGAVRGVSHASVAVSAAAQACVRFTSRLLTAVSAETAALFAPGLHFLLAPVASAQIALMRGSHILVRGVASAQAVAAIAGSRVVHAAPAAFSASSASLRRTVAKIVAVASTQVAIIGRVNFKIIGAVTTEVASRFAPKGLQVGAAHGQRALVVSWYHLFVPDWAYQQTTLLPPGDGPAEPPSFGPIDPADQTMFAFDWSARANFNDPIVSAAVVSVPAGMTFLGPAFTGGTLVEVTALPFVPPQIPATYSLRCTCVFASGRRSSFSIPVPIRNL